jgi:subtilisin family serine protease
MQRFAGLLAAGLIVAASALAHGASAAAPVESQVVANRYVVRLNDDAGISAHSLTQSLGINPSHVYGAALNGFAAELNQRQLSALRQHPGVAAIEADRTIALSQPTSDEQDRQPVTSSNSGISSASNVTAYVIDTGIYTAHPEFGGRATNVYDSFGGTGSDCNGHGTHVASVIGGATYGVAKDVRLRGVRVLDCNGSGTISGVIAGMNYVASNGVRPGVANMSFATSANTSVDNAATSIINRGIVMVSAAGNNNANACNYSPGRVAAVINVGASTATNTKAAYSNYGSCVDVYAPGTRTGAWLGGGSNTISGTDVAAAYVSGCVAKYLGQNPIATPATAHNWVISNARLIGDIRIFTCPL